MVACAPFPPSPKLPPSDNIFTATRTIKLLDLLTNRYHIGIIQNDWQDRMSLEFPLTSQLQEGQSVRFIIAGDRALVARQEMHPATITQSRRTSRTTQVELTLESQAA